ncbi:Alkyldihydroxyacetonephosphate synthase, peroxisomal [Seminavis robusta]|uniref:alkylglycerone-phosphate synthase n=1 Tax=Seminavis robusta TaxID=568900 RepID=A0A9N8HJ94_9STRA|nr:Alkyldihydroxyacetonephosphate synthase, peroxisomal [Seminavis robusta]|eukprot:Sro646_g180730.1 Alkyldihydroxyacetonephosphate synthase, peroxisomal (2375) ;mRNA; f:20958-28248
MAGEESAALTDELFEKVVERISSTSSSTTTTTTTTSNDTKLRLYGLYKYATQGPCQTPAASIWNPTAMAKQRAWKACHGMTKKQAQMEYATLAGSLDETCQTWLEEYQSKMMEEPTIQSTKDPPEKVLDTEAKTKPKRNVTSAKEGIDTSIHENPSALSSISLLGSWILDWLLFWILPTPVIPRGALDIDWSDLWFALMACVKAGLFYSNSKLQKLQDSILEDIQQHTLLNTQQQQQNTAQDAATQVVVGYSVRSLLDLYLMHKRYPPNKKQVIIVPPINIPGMVQIMEHYGLQVVPVDIPSSSTTTNTSRMTIDLTAVQTAITEQTVAIMVVHAFGNNPTATTTIQQQELRNLANQHNLELWLDAAESYTGDFNNLAASSVSFAADITFVSFGMIKTATSLGGGIAILQHQCDSVAAAMRRLQYHHYDAQTTWQFAWTKVCQAILIQAVSSSPIVYGIFVHLCLQWGGYVFFDSMVTRNVRSIQPHDNNNNNNNDNNNRSAIRIRPSLPLLQLLHRRLKQSTRTRVTVRDRMERCQEMTQILQQHAPGIGVLEPSSAVGADTYWLYPIQVNTREEANKRRIQRYLLEKGWDVAAGTSQLQCVLPTNTEKHSTQQNMQNFMSKVLYLPIASRPLSKHQSIELAAHLQQVDAMNSDDENWDRGGSSIMAPSKKWTVLPVLLLMFSSIGGGYPAPNYILIVMLPALISLLLYSFVLMVCLALAVRWLGNSSLYLESSTGFARYSSMIDQMCLGEDEKICLDSRRITKQSPSLQQQDVTREPPSAQIVAPNASVIASMPLLDLPAVSPLAKDLRGCAILTGATGFVGSLILRELLFHRQSLNLTAGVFVLCRGKRSLSAQERIDQLLKQEMFSFLSEAEKRDLVHVLQGDVTKAGAGLSEQDMNQLLSLGTQKKIVVTHVIHSAASVSFTQELAEAAQSNITSALSMQSLAVKLGQAQSQSDKMKEIPRIRFVHLSTAFVHGSMSGSKEAPLPEQLFPLDPYEPTKLYNSMQSTQFYASKAMSDLRFHNTYAFSKCVCEHLLLQEDKNCQQNVETMIVRPSIVGPALESPEEGWAGQKPSTIVAAASLYLSYQWNLWSFGSSDVPCIPVDVLSRFVLRVAFEQAKSEDTKTVAGSTAAEVSSSDDSFERVSSCSSLTRCSSNSQETGDDSATEWHIPRIRNAAWSPSSAEVAMFSWLDYCVATLHLGSNTGYFNRSTAYVGLWITSRLLPRIRLSFPAYSAFHYYLVQTPIQVMLSLCRGFGWQDSCYKLSKLSGFLDLPLLFFPYMNETFHFQSSLSAPETMNGSRYVFSCAVAAHRFLTRVNRRRNQPHDRLKHENQERMTSFCIGGKEQKLACGLWWALTQPNGSMAIRLAGWLFAYISGATCQSITVDLPSFEAALRMKLDAAKAARQESDEMYIVLAPTHRSFLDFILLSYLTFIVPELAIDIPKIAAADDFEHLPVIGWLAQALGAFYVRRGLGRADPELRSQVTKMKQHETSVIEVFLEGSRSRDRRFMEPKTGLLRSLAETGGNHLVVPISISYEKLPEQDILAQEAAGQCGRHSLNTSGLLRWLMDVARGNVHLGRIHVAAGRPLGLDCKSSADFKQVAQTVQVEQQRNLFASDYHVEATAKALSMDIETVRSAMTSLGCRHELARVCPCQHKGWRQWLNNSCEENDQLSDHGPEVASLSRSLLSLLTAADDQAERAFVELVAKGFHRPNLQHLQQTAQKSSNAHDTEIPLILTNAAASLLHSKLALEDDTPSAAAASTATSNNSTCAPVLLESEERLGFWGFRDSGFALQVSKEGSHYVVMRGDRYSVTGKSMSKLIPFVERETGVQINPFNEAFQATQKSSTDWNTETVLNKDDLKLLQSTVWKLTTALPDRTRHGSGHSQEDIFSIRSESPIRVPDAVVWPSSEAEVNALIALCKEKSWCLIPFGGGTNVTNATRCPDKEVEPRPIISVDMTKLNRLLWLNEEDGLACFEAGINGRDLVATLEQRGYTMGHEPDSIEFSTLGGWIATKASGMKRNKYGNIEDIIRSVRVASSSGIVCQNAETQSDSDKAVFGRESCGLDFRSIVLGSEGCLGIITSAVVKVWPIAEIVEHESILFPSFETGLGFARDISRLDRLVPASVRLLDNEHFRLGQALQGDPSSLKDRCLRALQALFAASNFGSSLDPTTVACATVCYEGSKSEVNLQKAELKRLAANRGGFLLGPRIGKAGYDLTFLIAYLRDFAMTYHFLGESFETFAPWSKVADIIDSTKRRVILEHEARCLPGNPFVGCRVTQLYHDGACLYFYVCINTENVANASHVFCEIEHAARCEILQHGGSLSHHHGIGKVRARLLHESGSPVYKSILGSVKETMDPDNIFAARNGLFCAY